MVLFYQVKDCARWLLQARYQSRLARQLDGERMVWVYSTHIIAAITIHTSFVPTTLRKKIPCNFRHESCDKPNLQHPKNTTYFLSRQCSGNDSNYCNSLLPAQDDSLNQNVATKEALT